MYLCILHWLSTCSCIKLELERCGSLNFFCDKDFFIIENYLKKTWYLEGYTLFDR